MDYFKLREELVRDERYEPSPYLDTKGIPTVGIGHNLTKPTPADVIELLQRRGIGFSSYRLPATVWPAEAIELLYHHDLTDAILDLDRAIPWWAKLPELKQRVLVNMCFNMGMSRLLGFRRMFDHLQRSEFKAAAEEMTNSVWYNQVGPRATRLRAMMLQEE